MPLFQRILLLGIGGLVLLSLLVGQQPPRETLAWAPLPSQPNGWVAPNEPI